jgi:uncharacterized protein with PQ loop repeat
MAGDASQVLAAIAIGYGVAAALSVLLQARQMLARGGSGDVSARFLAAYVGGYAIWLLYGLSLRDVPIIVVDALGLVCGAITLVVALRLRGPLLSPQAGTAVTRPRRLGMRQLRSRSGRRRCPSQLLARRSRSR